MKSYKPEDKRVVGFFGHRGSGKTSLVEALLFDAGVTRRLGSVEEQQLALEVCPEALERQMTIQCNVGYLETDGVRVGLIDAPGDANFWGNAARGLAVVDAAVVVVSGTDGLQPRTRRFIAALRDRGTPFAVFVSKVDKDNQSYDDVIAELVADVSPNAAVLTLPIGLGAEFRGVVGLVQSRAFLRGGESGMVPPEMVSSVAGARELLVDAVAAADDDLMEKYLEEGSLTEEELAVGLKAGFASGDVVPVFVGASTADCGGRPLLDFIASSFPNPLERTGVDGVDEVCGTGDGLVARAFRVHHDAFAGNLVYARVFSGVLEPSQDLQNSTRDVGDRPSHLYLPMGGTKDGVEIKRATAGDLVALTKLKHTETGDTLCPRGQAVVLPPFSEPDALLNFGLSVASTKDEDRVSQAIHRLLEEDPSLRFERDPETKEMLLGGAGQSHIDYVVHMLGRQGLTVELHEPQVPYRETLRAPIRGVEGKHKKQSGGSGQFGICLINIEPLPRGSGVEFVNQVVGGAIPRQYIPSVEKGIRDALHRGPLTGHEVVDLKITLYDGKYHSVDSSDMAFQAAGRKAIKAAFTHKAAKPLVLEPYMHLEISCPGDQVGDVMGDLNSRRGRVENMMTEGRRGKIAASVPMNEVLKYATVLRSITSGQGDFSMHFDKYEEAPANVAQQVMAAHTAHDDD